MRLPFSGRYAKLETMNRILTDAARKRTERIEELEDQLAQFERQVAHLKQELETARKAIERAREVEVVAAQRADLLNEKDKELADVREALTQRSLPRIGTHSSRNRPEVTALQFAVVAASLLYRRIGSRPSANRDTQLAAPPVAIDLVDNAHRAHFSGDFLAIWPASLSCISAV
jgi:hypothetical protein